MHGSAIKLRGEYSYEKNCKMDLEYHLLALEEASRMVMDKVVYA